MSLQILGKTKDLRSQTDVVYCKATINDYLALIGNEFQDFSIQRKRENHKAYSRLKSDLKEGALIPSLTLAVKHQYVRKILNTLGDNKELVEQLSIPRQVDILDGLQRTYIIQDLKDEGHIFDDEQELLLEFWLEPKMSKLIYRMIVLNAGQKAMSMRHQVELLFMSLKETVQEEIENIEIFVEKDTARRTSVNKYPLNVLASAYQAFITKSTEIDKNDIVNDRLEPSNSLESDENTQSAEFYSFINYFKKIKTLDSLVWEVYESLSDQPKLDDLIAKQKSDDKLTADEETELFALKVYKNAKPWLGSENVMIALFTAIAQMISTSKQGRVDTAIDKLIDTLKAPGQPIADPLGLVKYEKLKSNIDPRKSNVGYATRKLLLRGFKEYFRDEGDASMEIYWEQAKD